MYGGKKVYSLAYADNVVLMARDEEQTSRIIGKVEKYFEEKRLEVNTEKMNIMRCRKGGGE